MNEKNGGPLPAAVLDTPALAAVRGAQNGTELADGPAALGVQEEQAIERQHLLSRKHGPGAALIGAMEDRRSRPADDPDVVVHTVDCVEVPAGAHGHGQLEISVAPAAACGVSTEKHQPALAHRHAPAA